MKLPVRSDKQDVRKFLDDLKMILFAPGFDADRDFTLIRSRKETGKEQYSTYFTLLDLEYDTEDVIEQLRTLTLEEYSETLFDRDDSSPPLLFGRNIHNRQIYIKIKIRETLAHHVLCVSFHYAEHEMNFPYLQKRQGAGQ